MPVPTYLVWLLGRLVLEELLISGTERIPWVCAWQEAEWSSGTSSNTPEMSQPPDTKSLSRINTGGNLFFESSWVASV